MSEPVCCGGSPGKPGRLEIREWLPGVTKSWSCSGCPDCAQESLEGGGLGDGQPQGQTVAGEPAPPLPASGVEPKDLEGPQGSADSQAGESSDNPPPSEITLTLTREEAVELLDTHEWFDCADPECDSFSCRVSRKLRAVLGADDATA